jgi:hypothetical protein
MSDEKKTYRVWQDINWPDNTIHHIGAGALASVFPDDFAPIGEVRASDLPEALKLAAGIKGPRATMSGDVIVDPQGQAWRIDEDRLEAISQGTYRVWQAHDRSAAAAGWSAFPQDYRPAVDVFTDSRERAFALSHGGAWWEYHHIDVIAEHVRSTAVGDVIVDPAGNAHRIKPEGFERIDPATEKAAAEEPPLDRVERQLREWKHNNSPEFRPDPATGRIGPGTYRPAEDTWAILPEAGKLHVLEGELDWSAVGDRAKEALLVREVDFSKITRDQLNDVYQQLGSDDIDERPARRLFDKANYAQAVANAHRVPFDEQMEQVRPVTRNLIESIMLDAWPRNAAIVDFGIDSQRHYEALYYPIRNHEIAPLVLDAAMGHGEKLTELVRAAPNNPHKDIQFDTSWDELLGREKPEATDGRHDAAENGRSSLGIRDAWMAKLSIDDESRKELAAELERIKRDTYVDAEGQATGWMYKRGAGGYAFHELPVVERKSLIEDYIDWGKYMERGLTDTDQSRIMYHAARDPFPREQSASPEIPETMSGGAAPQTVKEPADRTAVTSGEHEGAEAGKRLPSPADLVEQAGPPSPRVTGGQRHKPKV